MPFKRPSRKWKSRKGSYFERIVAQECTLCNIGQPQNDLLSYWNTRHSGWPSRRQETIQKQPPLEESSNRGVIAAIAKEREDEQRKLWNKRVLLFGEIPKNGSGQPIKIDVSEVIQIPPEGEKGREFGELIGRAPDWTEGLESVEYLRWQRSA